MCTMHYGAKKEAPLSLPWSHISCHTSELAQDLGANIIKKIRAICRGVFLIWSLENCQGNSPLPCTLKQQHSGSILKLFASFC